MDRVWVGVDVSKRHLDVFAQSRFMQFSNDEAGVSELIEQLQAVEGCHAVVEATGGYEQLVVRRLIEAGFAASIVNPVQARQFCRAMGQAAKTDKIDARMLAEFGAVRQPSKTVLPSEEEEKIKVLSGRRDQVIAMIRQEKCALEHASDWVRDRIEAHLERLEEESSELQDEIDATFRKSELLSDMRTVLMEERGVGRVVSTAVLANMPELGRIKGKQASALAGLAPYAHDSGQKRGRRKCKGGRPQLRAALYMAALTAGRFNPKIKPLYDRLTAAGRPKKTVLIACARKLLVILNAVARDHLEARSRPLAA